jgi:hypothetical protein
MARLNGKVPENKGSSTGRNLGSCKKNSEQPSIQFKLGQGMGKRRNAGLIEYKNHINN